jgi:hypothetical protein
MQRFEDVFKSAQHAGGLPNNHYSFPRSHTLCAKMISVFILLYHILYFLNSFGNTSISPTLCIGFFSTVLVLPEKVRGGVNVF